MSMDSKIQALITRIGTEFKSVRSSIGTLANLTTTAKGDIVSAVNEVKASVGSAGAQINDTTASTTAVYSSSKTNSQIAQVKSDILGTASAAFDTLGELQAQMVADETGVAALTTAVGNRVRVDAAQGLTSGQQLQARSNIDVWSKAEVGPVDTDYVALLVTALS